MNHLNRYLIRTLLLAVLVVIGILSLIEVVIVLMGELSHLTNHYGILQALKFVILDMPLQINELFPMAGLIGTLTGLGILASQSELIVMQAAGISPMQISQAVLKAGLIIVVFNVMLGEWLAPLLDAKAIQSKALALHASEALITSNGLLLRQGSQFIFAEEVVNRNELRQVSGFIFNSQQQLTQSFSAQYAKVINHQWKLFQVNRSFVTPKAIQTTYHFEEDWLVNFDPELLEASQGETRRLSLLGLWDYINYLKKNQLDATSFSLTFWKRIFQPLATLVMILIAIPFIFGPLRSSTMGVRLIAGIAVGFVFYISNQVMSTLATLLQWPPILAVLAPLLLFLMAGFLLIRKVRA